MTSKLTKSNNDDGLIVGTILKCNDGRWTTSEGEPLSIGTPLFVRGMTKALRCWVNGELRGTKIERPGEPLPDAAELNEKISKEEWSPDLNGEPCPPWKLNYVVHLIDPATARSFTFLNSTTGAKIAYNRLKDCVDNMVMMRGPNVVPLVGLATLPMKTKKWGQKMRPEFTIIEWREFDGGGEGRPALLPPPTDGGPAGAAEKPERSAAKAAPGKPAVKIPGKPVTKPTLAEELRDDLPDFA